jgi:zinc transporter ZupT
VAPIAATIAPAEIPVGWELATQTIRRIKTPGAAVPSSSIKPTGVVVGATVGSMLAPMLAGVCASIGHPLPTEIALALPTVFAFVGGWLHPAGRA